MMLPSGLRIVGLLLALGGLWGLARLRRDRLLTRLELFTGVGLAAMGLVALFPAVANILPRLTGFTGALGRVTSVLAFATVLLTGLLLWGQTRLETLRTRFSTFLVRSAVEQTLDRIRQEGTRDLPIPQVALLMPALNEATNLAEVLPRAPRQILGLTVQVVVIDDGSDDGTAEVARDHGAWVVRSPLNSGGGHALRAGFWLGRRLGIPYLITLDADGQHRFEDLEQVVRPLISDEADLVVGSRLLGESIGHARVRAVGLALFNRVLSFLVGQPVTDCSSGYRGIRTAVLERLVLVQERHHTAEMIIEAARRKVRRVEVPITIQPRAHGESKKGTSFWYGSRFAWTLVSAWWRR